MLLSQADRLLQDQHQFLFVARLQQIVQGTDRDRLSGVGKFVKSGKEDDAAPGIGLPDPPGRLDPVDPRHLDIQDGDLDLLSGVHLQGLPPILCLNDLTSVPQVPFQHLI